MNDERRYTLSEAKRELAKEACALEGHSFDVILENYEPHLVVCSRCGRQWRVGEESPE